MAVGVLADDRDRYEKGLALYRVTVKEYFKWAVLWGFWGEGFGLSFKLSRWGWLNEFRAYVCEGLLAPCLVAPLPSNSTNNPIIQVGPRL